MKKLFGGINITWKKLILFAVISAIYTSIMAIIPITKDTSFRDIAVNLEWWILFGIIIISNSKSPKDSALKCFVFFLISQPLIYLIQVPFSSMGWGLFSYYKYWFIWTICTLPMGFIGYYINKKNALSMIILLPMLILLAYIGLGYFTEMMNGFPHHLLSFIFCFLIIIIIVLNLFDKAMLKIISLGIVLLFSIVYVVLKGGIIETEYDTYKSLDDYNITFVGKIKVLDYSGTDKGNVEVAASSDEIHSLRITGKRDGKYTFTITDDSKKEYKFKYYYSNDTKEIILEKVN